MSIPTHVSIPLKRVTTWGRKKRHLDEADWVTPKEETANMIGQAAQRAARDEPKRRMEFMDAWNKNEKRRAARFHLDGSLITVERSPMWEPYENERMSKRSQITGFSRKARHRFLLYVSSLKADEIPLFATLTYPKEWPEEWQSWKSHLDRILKRIVRKWPGACVVWKLEPQERGAPHYHMIIYGVPYMPPGWLARAWYEVVGSEDPAHLQAGTQVCKARSVRGVLAYAGKKYMGKEVHLPVGWDNVGRFWGVANRKCAPKSRRLDFTVSYRTSVRFRRLVRRQRKSKGQRCDKLGPIAIFTQNHVQWARAMVWAETGEPGDSIDFRLHPNAQPF